MEQKTKKGEIQLIIGPMFSGKTTELIRRIKRYEAANHKCMVVKYSKDDRYTEGIDYSNQLITHDRNRLNATVKTTILGDIQGMTPIYSVIGIDEGQFFKDIIDFSENMANMGKIVIVAALDGTYQRKVFGEILHLVPLAESVVKLRAVCMKCYNDASFTKRITCDLQVELIGGKESYLAVCRDCFYENINDEYKENENKRKKQLNKEKKNEPSKKILSKRN